MGSKKFRAERTIRAKLLSLEKAWCVHSTEKKQTSEAGASDGESARGELPKQSDFEFQL